MAGPWKEWTEEQWANAVFCEECGLPLIDVETENDGHGNKVGYHMCVFCTWLEDETTIFTGKLLAKDAENIRLRKAMKAAMKAATTNTIKNMDWPDGYISESLRIKNAVDILYKALGENNA